MKAEQNLKQEFVPVIVTLESQEEVNALYAVVNHTTIVHTIPILRCWQLELRPFRDGSYQLLHEKLEELLHPNN